ncbi:MAG TPA: hypothetical protein VM370_09055 [Candidatus Thermoplasmatota archaeon]|nr:hypothetical protein [Candidatus Thermoplasmatota archaeon]
MVLSDWVDRFAVWEGFHPDLQTLLIYGIGIAVYTALVFTFYQAISRRDPLHTASGKGWWGRALHAGETILTFPILSFCYFAVLAASLFVMAKPERATSDILLLSMAAVMGVRVTAHVSEGMSNDLAKLLPLGLLGVVLVDPGHLTLTGTLGRLEEAALMMPVLVQYFALFILSEAAMRGLRALFPGINRLAHKMEHKRHLSKRAMLRDVEHEHGGAPLFSRTRFHEHGPRDRSHDFLALDEGSGGKPGSRQGVGPALPQEGRHASAHGKPAAPKAGPGGSGGRLRAA